MWTEWIILADYVEYTSGKLYMMGGGWEHLTINHPARIHNCGIAAAFRVDWDEINVPHDVTLSLFSSASNDPLAEVQALVELGHKGKLSASNSQLAQLAVNLTIEFPAEGNHYLRTTIDGREDRTFPFAVRFGHELQRDAGTGDI